MNRRLRIKSVNHVDDGEAIVTAVIDYYSRVVFLAAATPGAEKGC